MMYFHIYRTTIRSLGLDWQSFVVEDSTNLPLLRNVEVKHCKGKEYLYVPGESVLEPARKRCLYQTQEYDQFLKKSLNIQIH